MTPYYADDWLTIWLGDCRAVLATLPAESVNCVVTSPPYWGLRDYGHADQIGLEAMPDTYVAALVAVFSDLRRVLHRDGTVWLNLGDSYATGAGSVGTEPGGGAQGDAWKGAGHRGSRGGSPMQPHTGSAVGPMTQPNRMPLPGLKPKDRVMIPARVALALQADGWWLRDEIVWHKPNPMPSSVRDRTTPAHEMVYLLTKSARYAYDADAIAERGLATNFHDATSTGLAAPGQTPQRGNRVKVPGGWDIAPGAHDTIHRTGRTSATYRETTLPGNVSSSTERQRVGLNARWDASEDDGTAPTTRNKRSVWTVATQPYPEAHFATFPEALIEPMILAGCPTDGVVLDPFGGSGTVAVVAQRLGRKAVLIDLSADYAAQMLRRIGRARAEGDGPAVDMPVPFAAGGLWDEAL